MKIEREREVSYKGSITHFPQPGYYSFASFVMSVCGGLCQSVSSVYERNRVIVAVVIIVRVVIVVVGVVGGVIVLVVVMVVM